MDTIESQPQQRNLLLPSLLVRLFFASVVFVSLLFGVTTRRFSAVFIVSVIALFFIPNPTIIARVFRTSLPVARYVHAFMAVAAVVVAIVAMPWGDSLWINVGATVYALVMFCWMQYVSWRRNIEGDVSE